MLGFGLGLTHFGTRGGVSDTPDSSVSGAALMLASEPEGFAIDFSDASICIKDLTTPANSFASQGTVLNGALVGPGAKITYTSPSPKLCKKADGTYGYRAQNLYLNSEAPANQSVTVVSGLPYIIAVTGTVSITLSGAATGTVTAGNPITFTASSGTLTCGSTSGAGTVHLRSTIAATDYIKTTSAPLYDLPYDWTGAAHYPLSEPAATNLINYSQDFNGASWSKGLSTTVAVNNAVGLDGALTADTITQVSGSNYIQQRVTAGVGTYTGYVIARAGSLGWIRVSIYDSSHHEAWFNLSTGVVGTVQSGITAKITLVTTGTYLCSVTFTTTAINPYLSVFGANADNSGSALGTYVLLHAQLEAGTVATSPIITGSATVTRAADNLSIATSAFPSIASAVTMYAVYSQPHGHVTAAVLSHRGGDNNNRVDIETGSSTTSRPLGAITTAGVSQMSQEIAAAAYVPGTFTAVALAATTNDANVARDGTVGTTDTSVTMPSTTKFIIGSRGGGLVLNGHFKEIMVLPRIMTNAELQALTA